MRTGLTWGTLYAGIYSTVAIFIAAGSGHVKDPFLGKLILTYVASGVTAGVLVGLLLPLRETILGTALLGAVGGVPVFYGFALLGAPISEWRGDAVRDVLTLGCTIGPLAALSLRAAIKRLP